MREVPSEFVRKLREGSGKAAADGAERPAWIALSDEFDAIAERVEQSLSDEDRFDFYLTVASECRPGFEDAARTMGMSYDEALNIWQSRV